MQDSLQKTLTLPSKEGLVRLLGPRDVFLRMLRRAFQVKVVARGQQVRLEGRAGEVAGCEAAMAAMQERLDSNEPLTEQVVGRLIENQKNAPGDPDSHVVQLEGFSAGRVARTRTAGQARYVRAMQEHDIVFCIGPAGTGKTYLAVAMALDHLRRGVLKKIVLSRPAVEAGEHLGFLPGDMRAKVNPYVRPLYDALHDLMPPRQVRKYIDDDLIDILPLAYMRGRTLDDAFIILDEAQNCTIKQMKTFLTRMGQRSKIVVTGDVTQIDLASDDQSGLVDAKRTLADVPSIAFVGLGMADILRHRLVQEIVNAYDGRASRGERPESVHDAGGASAELDREPHSEEVGPENETNASPPGETEPGLEA